jgi:hypothetical protein
MQAHGQQRPRELGSGHRSRLFDLVVSSRRLRKNDEIVNMIVASEVEEGCLALEKTN